MFHAPVLFLVLVTAADKPTPKFPLGKETTYVTGPLDKEGYIDYEAALNERLSKGITPDKNANVLLWKVFGPRPEGGAGMPAEFFKRLGMEEPPARGDYLVPLDVFLKEHLKLERSKWQVLYEQESHAGNRVWTAKDYPDLAAWLKLNEKPLARAVEATRRPEYFNPLVSRKREPGGLISVLLPGVQKSRELANALRIRALLRVGEGKIDEAWQDLLACHRLARLISRGATIIEGLVGIAIDHMACASDLAYLERAKLTSKQIQACLNDLQTLPPLPSMADRIDLGERLMCLDGLQMIRRGNASTFLGQLGGAQTKVDPKEEAAMARIDWEPALRNCNKWYDRLAAAMRLKDRTEREAALTQIEKDLGELKQPSPQLTDIAKLLLGKDTPGKVVGKKISDVLIGLMIPAARKVQQAQDRAEQVQRNLQLAFALARYQREHGRYPTKLDDLAPKYVKAIPNDLFSGQPLIYRPMEKGYLLYSVGVNGKDEEGRWYDDNPPGDDPRVRMPLPPLPERK